MMTDPIADLLTRIRNASNRYHRHVQVPGSKVKQGIAEILVKEGFIESFNWTDDGKQGVLHLELKYDEVGAPIIGGLERISKPGRRMYAKSDEIPRVRSGLGIVVISTSKGLMTGKEAREQNMGGELVCSVW